MDDDCRPVPDLLRALSQVFRETPAALVGGRIVNALPHNLCSAASQLLLDYLYEYYNADPAAARFLASMNIAVPRERFLALEGFDRRFTGAGGEDREFCHRWLVTGAPMSYRPEAIVHHSREMDLRAFWRQHFKYGKGAFRYQQCRRDQASEPVPVEPRSFYLGLLLRVFRSPLPRSLVMFSLISVSQVANVLGYFFERYTRRSEVRV
jgi:GT2 family glycosyltransferase